MGIHRWDGYSNYYATAVKTIVYLLDNFCLGCHRGSFQVECPFEARGRVRVECGIGSALMQCIEYVEDNDYLDPDERENLDEIASLARELKNHPWEGIPEEERGDERLAPLFRRNSKYGELEKLAEEYLEEKEKSQEKLKDG